MFDRIEFALNVNDNFNELLSTEKVIEIARQVALNDFDIPFQGKALELITGILKKFDETSELSSGDAKDVLHQVIADFATSSTSEKDSIDEKVYSLKMEIRLNAMRLIDNFVTKKQAEEFMKQIGELAILDVENLSNELIEPYDALVKKGYNAALAEEFVYSINRYLI